MKLRILAVGHKVSPWVSAGYADYAKRFPKDYSLTLQTLAAAKRSPTVDRERLLQKETAAIKKALPAQAYLVATRVAGQAYSTQQLADRLQYWQARSSEVVFLVGGADGLSSECLSLADEHWSLSPLTLPHGLIRVVLAEQLYRAWSILHQHPYHRD